MRPVPCELEGCLGASFCVGAADLVVFNTRRFELRMPEYWGGVGVLPLHAAELVDGSRDVVECAESGGFEFVNAFGGCEWKNFWIDTY